MKFAYLGGPGAFGAGPAAFSIAGFEPTAAGGRADELPLPASVTRPGGAEELFSAAGLDFAAISLPPEESFKAVRLALGRGLHVFCEPPFCRTVTELEELREAAETAGRALFPAQPWEHSPSCRALEKALTRGLAGEAAFACVRLSLAGPAPRDWAAAPEAWQAVSLLLGAVRRPPTSVEARFSAGAAALHVHFGGADGFVHLYAGEPAPRLRVSVTGDKGGLELDGAALRLEPRGLAPETLELSAGAEPGRCRPEWLEGELLDFKKEAEGARPRGSGLRNARYCVRVLKGAAASSATRCSAMPL